MSHKMRETMTLTIMHVVIGAQKVKSPRRSKCPQAGFTPDGSSTHLTKSDLVKLRAAIARSPLTSFATVAVDPMAGQAFRPYVRRARLEPSSPEGRSTILLGRTSRRPQESPHFENGLISALLGIHLTGLDDLSPRAVRRRSLQAGRMSALSRRLGRNSLWALAHNKVLVTNRSMRDSKLQDPVEQHPSAT